jgi:hypothetical protein
MSWLTLTFARYKTQCPLSKINEPQNLIIYFTEKHNICSWLI